MNSINFEARLTSNSYRVLLDPHLVDHEAPAEPVRRHKKKRIAKKWLKRYGYRWPPDPNIYIVDGIGGRGIIMHPAIFKKFEQAIGSPEGAMEAIIKALQEENKDDEQKAESNL